VFSHREHPVKVHVWAGISMRGRTGICIFEGIINAPVYIDVLEKTLLPFLSDVYPDGHRFMQHNDPKHTSSLGRHFLEDKEVTWWKTPPESPYLNLSLGGIDFYCTSVIDCDITSY